jgi:di/tricarboxylate transporter
MIAAAGAAAVCFTGRFILAALLYRAEKPPTISKDRIKGQLTILGKLNSSEWTAIAASVIFLFGVITSKIMTPWVAVLILFAVLFVGELTKEEFRKEIDWPFLLFLGGLIGFVNAFSYLGFDKIVGNYLSFLAIFMTSNFYLFIVLLTGITLAIRLILPANAAFALLCVALLPVAQVKAVNPWIVGFCILISSNGWFFPYQSTFYTTLCNSTKGKLFTDQQTAPYNIWGNLINLVALLLSVPYWQMLGLLK